MTMAPKLWLPALFRGYIAYNRDFSADFYFSTNKFYSYIMVALCSFTVRAVYKHCDLVCMYYQLYEHAHAELYVAVFTRS